MAEKLKGKKPGHGKGIQGGEGVNRLNGWCLVAAGGGRRVFNTRIQQTEETYHITFDESPDAIKFSRQSVNNINIAEIRRYPSDEYLHPYKPSQNYQTKTNDVSFIEPYECHEPVILETEGSSDQNGQADQNDQSAQTDKILNDDMSEHSNHTNNEQIIDNSQTLKTFRSLNICPLQMRRILRWSQDKHIELVNIIGNPGARMLTREMDKELSAASAHECLFVDFLSEEEPKKHEGKDYDETFDLVARLKAIRIFLAFVTYMNFIVYQMDVKSAFLNGKLKEEVYIKQPPAFESNEFPNHVCKLDKALYGLKQAPRACGKALNKTQYRGMIGSLMSLTISRPDIQSSTCLCVRYQANPKESHLIIVKRIFRKSTSGACQLLGGKLVCWSAKN
nr:retrovirus-related Pol polyprotein from transposon TNT 1-94 [Tanacetum cinerariifolium]